MYKWSSLFRPGLSNESFTNHLKEKLNSGTSDECLCMDAHGYCHTSQFTFISHSERHTRAEYRGSYKYSEHMGGGCGKIGSSNHPWLCMEFEVSLEDGPYTPSHQTEEK